MLQKTPKQFRKLFLLEFTRQLIKASSPEFFLKEQIKEKEIEEKQKIKQILKHEKKPLFSLRKREIPRHAGPKILTIPAPRLPSRLQYLRPTPTNIQIDLGKLNPLIKDPAVQVIECYGPDEKIMVKIPLLKPTNIILTKQEIDEVINKFSQTAKIPADHGFFRVAVGNLNFSAIVSETTGSRFIIKKMIQQRQIPFRRQIEFRPMPRR